MSKNNSRKIINSPVVTESLDAIDNMSDDIIQIACVRKKIYAPHFFISHSPYTPIKLTIDAIIKNVMYPLLFPGKLSYPAISTLAEHKKNKAAIMQTAESNLGLSVFIYLRTMKMTPIRTAIIRRGSIS